MSESTLTCKRTLSETGTVGVGAGDSDNAEDAKKLCVKDNDNDNEDGCEETAEPLEADAEQEQPVEQQVDTEKQSRVFGMKERVNKTFKRFFGKIKQNLSDFIVNEIDLNGSVVRLTSFDLPQTAVETAPTSQNDPTSPEELNKLIERLKVVVGEEKCTKLMEFLQSETKSASFKIEAPKDKEDRKSIHDFIKVHFKNFTSNTISDKDVQYIDISHNKFKRSSMKDCYKNNSVKREMAEFKYCECAMYKENIDTIQAVNLIVKHLRLNSKRIGYSGTKDKKAKTTQLLSFFKIEPSQLLRLNRHFHNVKLGNFTLRNGEALKLGDLSGNRFNLLIREIDESDDVMIRAGAESLKSNGFINYFGLQRFGNSSEIPTHHIGKLLLQNRIKEAIDCILKPRTMVFEKEEIKRAREIWQTSKEDGARRALALIDRMNCVEKYVLHGLSACARNDYLGAFQFIPRNMRTMYLHAYQSYLWNEAASERMKLFGLKLAIGDLVMRRVEEKGLTAAATPIRSENKRVVVVDATNIGEYDIADVVLPLPGYDVAYPQNESVELISVKEFYSEVVRQDELNLESFRNKIKDFSLSGDYRYFVVKPIELDYTIMSYSKVDEELVKSDLDLMKKDETPKDQPSDIVEEQSQPEICSTFKALRLEFSLPSSSYATVVLRELLDDKSKL